MSNVFTQRLSVQLDTLSNAVRALIEQSAFADETIDIEVVHCANVYGPEAVANAISVRMKRDAEYRKLVVYPIHAGSLTDTSVGIIGTDTDSESTLDVHNIEDSSSIDNIASFYARLAPLPLGWPTELYRSTHCVTLQVPVSLSDINIDAIVAALASAQGQGEVGLKPEHTSIALTYLNAEQVDNAQHTCDLLGSVGGWRANAILIDRLIDFHALLGATSFAIYSSEPACADALVAGVPCAAMARDGSVKRLNKTADIDFENAPKHGQTQIKYQHELMTALQQCFGSNTSKLLKEPASQPILTVAEDIEHLPNLSTRFGRSLDQGQRKYKKFRESPSRFVNDSQSPLLRPFKNKRLSS